MTLKEVQLHRKESVGARGQMVALLDGRKQVQPKAVGRGARMGPFSCNQPCLTLASTCAGATAALLTL